MCIPLPAALAWGGEVAIVGGLLMGGASVKAWISEIAYLVPSWPISAIWEPVGGGEEQNKGDSSRSLRLF